MVYNLVSVKQVIAKILSDSDIHDENIRLSDYITWLGEALAKIGAFPTYVVRITGKDQLPLLHVEDYQVQLPSDLVQVLGVSYCKNETGQFVPLRYGTGTYGYKGDDTTSTQFQPIVGNNEIIYTAMTLYDYTYEQALNAVNSDPDLKDKLMSLIKPDSSNAFVRNKEDLITLDYVYYINNNYIKLNVRDGYLKVAYQAMAIDEDGYPMIPDDESFMEALYWYVRMKLLYPLWSLGNVRDRVYDDAVWNWNYYCKQAFGRAMMPSVDKLESLKNQWLQLFPEIYKFNGNFSTLGDRQIIYTQ